MIRSAPAYSPPADTGLDIRYFDADLLVVDKPSGLLSVPGRGSGMDDNLAKRVSERSPHPLAFALGRRAAGVRSIRPRGA